MWEAKSGTFGKLKLDLATKLTDAMLRSLDITDQSIVELVLRSIPVVVELEVMAAAAHEIRATPNYGLSFPYVSWAESNPLAEKTYR